MSRAKCCRHADCERLISRSGYCRPHFISEHLGWTIHEHDLRQVPLGRLTPTELDALREATFGEHKLWRVLQALREMGHRSKASTGPRGDGMRALPSYPHDLENNLSSSRKSPNLPTRVTAKQREKLAEFTPEYIELLLEQYPINPRTGRPRRRMTFAQRWLEHDLAHKGRPFVDEEYADF